jgi:L,D-transpeptidase YcbB
MGWAAQVRLFGGTDEVMVTLARLLTIGSMAVLAACGGKAPVDRGPTQEQIATSLRAALAVKRPPYVTADAEGRKLWKLTQQFYAQRDFEPAWLDGHHPARQMGELIAALHAVHDEGLEPELYNVGLLEARHQAARRGVISKRGFEAGEAGTIDTWLTYLYLKHASDLADGLSDLAHADPSWLIKPEAFDAPAYLDEALSQGTVRESLAALTPATPQYTALKAVLADYRAKAAAGGWSEVPPDLTLKPGDRHPGVAALAARLSVSDDYRGPIPAADPAADPAAEYGDALIEAVRAFQRRHGLQDDGVVGPATVAQLNVSIEERIAQIELNLERWRWLPRDLGSRYILVNIPEYRLEVWEGNRVPLAMRVVVGKRDTPTPIFNDRMSYIVLSPYWYVPPTIAEGETLPSLMRDPTFLERTNMEVLDAKGNVIDPAAIDLDNPTQYRFRQRPGVENSLGLVKFMFPNEHNVYLHDTPADSLFARASRSFSHGCVRLEQPLALAEYVLGDQRGWTRERIESAMHAYEERTVKLREPLPVYLGYWTARVRQDGSVQFREDVYGIDRRQSARLSERLATLRRSAEAAALALNDVTTSVSASSGSIQ